VLQELVEIQRQTLEEIKAQRQKKKGIWDRFSTISIFLSTVVIASLGLYFTHMYNERQHNRESQTQVYQTRILEMQTVEKFVPHLTTASEETKKVALLALTSLGSSGFATKFAQLSPSEGTESAADRIMATASSIKQRDIPTSISTTASSTREEGWAYLGHYVASEKQWKTRYFDFGATTAPRALTDSESWKKLCGARQTGHR
jgi:hypothetical protein